MIYLTGDIHGDPLRLSEDSFPEQREMTKEDYVIVLGDFGIIWEHEMSPYENDRLKWLDKRPFTTLFVDGNHENHDRLDSYPVTEWNGGKIHQITPSVFHLMRGQVFNLNGHKLFSFGGARSHDIRDGILDKEKDYEKIQLWSHDYDKLFRVNKESWWEREMPNEDEMEEGRENLAKYNYKVDYVLTHCASAETVALAKTVMGWGYYEQDDLTNYLQEIRMDLKFQHWYFGHYHRDCVINAKETCLYRKIVRIV